MIFAFTLSAWMIVPLVITALCVIAGVAVAIGNEDGTAWDDLGVLFAIWIVLMLVSVVASAFTVTRCGV